MENKKYDVKDQSVGVHLIHLEGCFRLYNHWTNIIEEDPVFMKIGDHWNNIELSVLLHDIRGHQRTLFDLQSLIQSLMSYHWAYRSCFTACLQVQVRFRRSTSCFVQHLAPAVSGQRETGGTAAIEGSSAGGAGRQQRLGSGQCNGC